MRAFAADFHAHIEPLRDYDSACWTPSNDVLGGYGKNNGSNHLGGTGMDLNWNGEDEKTFRYGIPKSRAYPGDKSRRLDELIDFYEGMIFCGGEWSNRDWMHFQMGYGTYDSNNDRPSEKVLDFIKRKIRPDGFSTYKRGVDIPKVDLVKLLADLMDNVPGVDYAKLLPFVQDCLVKSGCNNNNRIAMWGAQIGHESVGLRYMKEIGDAAYFAKYNNRSDLGNGPTDGPRYPGRGPIQVTGRNNYRKLSQWAFKEGYCPTPTYFEDHPTELEKYEYAFLGAIWYWTVAQPRINEYCDRGDVENVSKFINAPAWVGNPNRRANGIQDRIRRWDRAKAMNLMPLIEEDELAGVDVDRLNKAVDKILGGGTMPDLWTSRGMFAPADETFGGVDDTVGMLLNTDANAWNIVMIIGALLGVERDVQAIKDASEGKFPEGMHEDNPWRKARAQEFAQKLLPLCGLMNETFFGTIPATDQT